MLTAIWTEFFARHKSQTFQLYVDSLRRGDW